MRDADTPADTGRGAATITGPAMRAAAGKPAARVARTRIRRVASSLLFQSTALAGTMAGIPMPIYSRAYAQATCSPSSTSDYINDGAKIAATTFNCTISSGSTVTSPQYAYGGTTMFYQNSNTYYGNPYSSPPLKAQPGLNISITNNATLDVSDGADVGSMISFSAPNGTNLYKKSHSDAIGVVSVGSGSVFNGDKNNSDYVSGPGGTVIVTNSGSITNAKRNGIYAVSAGGTAYNAPAGNAGPVTVTTSESISAQEFGIVAISRGGATWAFTGGDGGDVSVTVSGDVSSIASTSAGGGILAASYGGNSPNNLSWNDMEGGTGGNAGSVTLTLGSSSTPFAGSVTTTAAGSIGEDWSFFTRNTGAALSAVSYGGQGPVNTNGSGSGYDGGNGGKVELTVNGTSKTLLKTSGDSSIGALAASYGGSSLNYYDASKSGGAAADTMATLSGGGTVSTAGKHSSGIVAVSLGGLGKLASSATSAASGKGGVAGNVTLTNDFAVTTKGDHSHGLVAISAGAGGGLFVWSDNAAFQWGDTNIASNTSGTVNVTNTGTIKTYGVDSHGIIAQSIGGGGGALTSYSDISTDSYGAVTTSSPTQTIGGYSGSANGYGVTVVNHGSITTYGGYASGADAKSADGTNVALGGGIAILAQSIGGGGGNNTGHGAIGGTGGSGKSGGTGSNGGTSYVNNYAALTTYGSEAHGIVAQSIGGGGGTGRNRNGLFVAVGGDGGNGGNGNKVDVLNDSKITLSGDYATGIIAQSIGGGGGAGGKATAWGVGFSSAIGGYGGYGGDGGEAKVETGASSAIAASGTNGVGILVQSIGGGGGSGGAAKTHTAGVTFDISIASGGNGGGGGDGGEAYVKHAGSILTSGYDSAAIIVQSVGGGGGQGGVSTANSLAVGLPFDEKGDSLALAVAISHGGQGAGGGDGGDAKAVIEKGASATTKADGSIGVHVQSIGGGGGAGGDSTAAAGTATLQSVISKLTDGQGEHGEGDSVTTDLTFSLGGGAGVGGGGGTAYAHTYGAIATSGDFSDGMLVQSVGGGGGAGGTGETDGISTFGGSTFSLSLSIGGTAGDGGDGGQASGGIADTGSVTTAGSTSPALVVHSIGGGGGEGGGGSGDVDADNTLTVGAGATGGTGGDGGNVYAWNNGTITTTGDSSSGIVAQSVGGGGGQGGSGTSSIGHASEFKSKQGKTFKDWLKLNPTFDVTTTLTANTGASGGAGGDGGQVVVGNAKLGNTDISDGKTTTSGSFSAGVLAQSIGGGGGAVSVSSSVNDADLGLTDADLDIATISFGAKDGSFGTGGTVIVYAANTYTTGFSAPGVIAQSIGGGGGVGIVTGYAMDSVDVKFGAESQPSGGGRAAGTVTVNTLADTKIVTHGDHANGIIAQSIGGGGGLAGVALGTYDAVTDDSISDVISVTFGGGSAEGQAHGNAVTVDHSGSLTTYGNRSVGVVAQSVSGGGGFVAASATNFDAVEFVQNQAPNSATSVDVSVKSGASIVTSGDGAVGILAQTVSGGGGVAADLTLGLTPYYSYYNSTSTAGTKYYYNNGVGVSDSTGDVTVTIDGSVSTTGKYAHGIVAQGIGGSGGIFTRDGKTYAGTLGRFNNPQDDKADGNSQSGSVSVTVNGSVAVSDPTSWAIWGQATGTALTVTVGSDGKVTGSQAAGSSGVYAGGAIFVSGADKTKITLDNSGTVTGNVVHYEFATGDEDLDTDVASATVGATADFASGPRFLNQGAGTFVTGAIADIATVLNAGTINVGGAGTTLQTTVTGDLIGVQSDTSATFNTAALGLSSVFTPVSYFEGLDEKNWRSPSMSMGGLISGLDVDMELGTSDTLLVQGDLAGTWGTILNPYALLPNVRSEFLKAEGTDSSELSILPTLIYRFTDVTTSSEGWKGFQVQSANFSNTGVGLGRNAAEISRGLQDAWDRLEDGSSSRVDFGRERISIAQAFGAFHAATPSTFEQMLTPLAGQTSIAPLATAPQGAIAAANSVLSCPAFTTGLTLEEGECVWGRFLGSRAQQDPSDGAEGFKEDTTGIQAGGQAALGDGWFLGGSLTYEDSWFRNDAGTQKLYNKSFTAAAALKKEIGPWMFAVAGGAGYNWGDAKRYVSLGSLYGVAESEPNSSVFFGRARASYEMAFEERFYLQPMVDLDVITVHQQGYTETGAGGLNLIVNDSTKTVYGLTPGVQIGKRFDMAGGLPARLFAGVGVSFLSDDEYETTARFAGLSSMNTFSTYMPINDTVGRVNIGLDLQKVHGMQLKVQYDGAFADGYQFHGGSLRFGYRF